MRFDEDKLRDEVETMSSKSVEYCISHPIYYFYKIQSILEESFSGKKLLVEEREAFHTINSAGGDISILMNLEKCFGPQTLDSTLRKEI